MPNQSLHKVRLAAKSPANVDTENNAIMDVILCEVGTAKGHGFAVEQSFIDAVAEAGKKMKEVKCNLGHNWDNLGKQLGRFKNIRLDGTRVLGDLYFYNAADNSPVAPGMAQWVKDLAAEDASALMCSIVFYSDFYYQKDENGTEIKVWEYNDDDMWISPNYDMPIYIKFKELISCDIVDEGALTTTLFSAENEMLNRFNDILAHPEFKIMLEQNFKSFTPLNEFYANHYKKPLGLAARIKEFLGFEPKTPLEMEKGPDEVTDTTPVITQLSNTDIDMTKEELNAILDERETALKTELSGKIDSLQTELDSEKTKSSELETKLKAAEDKIKELEATPAEEHAAGETSTQTKLKGLGPHHAALKAEYKLP